jgi:hypothetical protein
MLSGQMMLEATGTEQEKTIAFKVAVVSISDTQNLDHSKSIQHELFDLLDANNSNDNITATCSFDNTYSFEEILESVRSIESATVLAQQELSIENNSTVLISTATRNAAETDSTFSLTITPHVNDNTTLDFAIDFDSKRTLLPSQIVPGQTFIISNENVVLIVATEIIA